VKIVSATARLEAFDLVRPYTIAFRQVTAVENLIVELRTDNGLVGLGAAAPEPHVTGETTDLCAQALLGSALDWLMGCDGRELESLLRELARRTPGAPAARAAVDGALHDLFAQFLGLPLVQVLGQVHPALPTSITIGIKPLTETLEEADEYLGRGFRILKVKVGRNLEEDIERLVFLRERVGPHIALRVDPNQGYTVDQLTKFVERTETLDLEFFEQPVKAASIADLCPLPAAIRRRIAADESLLDEADALGLVRLAPVPCGIFNIKLMKCGGIAPARGIARLAALAGIDLMWGCMDESIVSISAALHAALASPATRFLDLDGSFDLARDVVRGGFVVEDGCLRPHGGPGLGLTLL